jgi:hypothetical protein
MWFGADSDDAYDYALGLLGWMLAGLDGTTAPGHSARCARPSPFTTPLMASCTTLAPGSSGHSELKRLG